MVLSIESSCDDSSIAITQIATKKVIFHKKISQELQHNQYGGVVPELASRLHTKALPDILEHCKPYFSKLKAIAVTTNPGLAVTLIEGVSMAKALSLSLNIPLISVNHLKGHVYSLFIEKTTIFPILVLLVSGGHTQLIDVKSHKDMKIVATTIDDSFGESFDKVAKMLELGYPGGAIVESYAKKGNMNTYDFPVPLRQSNKIQFSYSGLKNAVRLQILKHQEQNTLTTQTKYDICASFQKKAVEHILMKLKKYLKKTKIEHFGIVGGASANAYLKTNTTNLLGQFGCNNIQTPQMQYCSDNAVMIGAIAIQQYLDGDFVDINNLDISTKGI